MIKIRTLLVSVIAGSLITAFPFLSSSVLAASNLLPQTNSQIKSITNSGLSVTPALNNITVLSGQSSAVFNETVKNLASYGVSIAVTAQDFGALNGTGTIGFFGAGYNPNTNSHSLVKSIEIANKSFYLAAGSSRTVQVSIINPNSLAPGGHYGAIIFTPSVTAQSNTNSVSLQPSVAALVFISTATGGTQSIAVSSFSVSPIRFSLPTTTYVLLSNTGNTQLTPRAYIGMYGPNGKLVSQTDINTDSGQILPGSNRLFTVSLPAKFSLFQLPGFYHLKLSYRYDGASTYSSNTIRFFYFNPLMIFYIALVGVIIYLFIRILSKNKGKSAKK